MKKRFLITVLGLAMGSALVFSGCGSKKDTKDSSSATVEQSKDSTKKAAESSKEETTTAGVKVDINYDIANHLDDSYEDVGKAFGDPVSDEAKDGGQKVVKYANPERELHYYGDDTSGYVLQAVSAKAGDLLSFTSDKVSLDDILDKMEGTQVKGLEANDAFLTIGEKGDSTVLFQSEGYYFVVSVDKDKMVSKDSAVAVLTEDRVSLDPANTSSKAPSDIKKPETKAAESTTAKK